MVVLNETHRRRLRRDYLAYYHRVRTHLSLAKDSPEPGAVQRFDLGRIVETPPVGGSIIATAGWHRKISPPAGCTGHAVAAGAWGCLAARGSPPLPPAPSVLKWARNTFHPYRSWGCPTANRPPPLHEHPGWLNGRDTPPTDEEVAQGLATVRARVGRLLAWRQVEPADDRTPPDHGGHHVDDPH